MIFRDFEFRVNYKSENKLSLERGGNKIKLLLNDWSNQKKTFRLIKRYSFTSGKTEFPFRIDCSIVKTSKKRKYYIPEYTVEQSEVFNNPENYEIEVELLNDRARFLPQEELIIQLKNIIKVILSDGSNLVFQYHLKKKRIFKMNI